MIVVRNKHKDTFLHSYSQEQLELIKEHCSDFYNNYFTEL
jgi:hypothetical protein